MRKKTTSKIMSVALAFIMLAATATQATAVPDTRAELGLNATAALEDGLVAWYKFDELKPDTTNKVEDATGITGDITLNWAGATQRATISAAGKSGGALRLDNGNTAYHAYAQLPDNILNDAVDFTISSWVNAVSYTNFSRWFDFGGAFLPNSGSGSYGPERYMFMTLSNGSAGVYETTLGWATGAGTQAMNFPRVTTTNTWIHYAITRDSTGTRIYRNGAVIATGDPTYSPKNANFIHSYLGKSQFDGNNSSSFNDGYFNCSIDDFKMYDKALSSVEIMSQYISYLASDQEIVNAVAPNVAISGDLSAVVKDITLIQGPIGGASITWSSSAEGIVSSTGKVTRPAESAAVELTAVISKGEASVTKTFRVYVIGSTVSPYEIKVNLSKKGVDVSPDMFGIFYEDINFAADGGLYGELVRNRSFEFGTGAGTAGNGNATGWTATGLTMSVVRASEEERLAAANRNFLRITSGATAGRVTNDGFGGIAVQAGKDYLFEAYVKTSDYAGPFGAALRAASGDNVYGTVAISPLATEQRVGKWTRIAGVIRAGATDANARLALSLEGAGTVDVDMVSLFPQDTFRGRQNGLRQDLAESLKELQPGFVRFPGGCLIEGYVASSTTAQAALENAYRWKETIGLPSEREFDYNVWNSGSLNYYQTFGLGFFEYFLLCEDIGAQPVPVLNAAIPCQARGNSKPLYAVGSPEFMEYVQDAIDLVEFCNGDVTTTWGAKRAAMGHPEPFNLKYLGFGNEQWGQKYYDRYDAFVKEFRKYYGPEEIVLISGSGTASSGSEFDNAWNWIRSNDDGTGYHAGLVDEHYYNSPSWFLENAGRYDKFSRTAGAKVFAGEYAAHGTGRNNNMEAALTEAAYMTGLERNADVVRLASYAPLFNKIGYSQWTPDMIWFNNSDLFYTPNYYAQQMYMKNLGDHTYTTTVTKNTDPTKKPPYKYYGSAGVGSWATAVQYDDFRLVDNLTGNTLYADDFSAPNSNWLKPNTAGTWAVADGVLSQTSATATDCRYYVNTEGSGQWRNYTLTVRAKKTSGSEAFLIPFFVRDANNYMHLNIGGWNNTSTAIEEAVGGTKTTLVSTGLTAQTDVWYNYKIVTGEYSVECYYKLDTDAEYKPIFSLDLRPSDYGPVYASAVKDLNTGDIIIKAVNYTENDSVTRISMSTAGLNPVISTQVLTSEDTGALNSMADKNAVKPVYGEKTVSFDIDGFDVTLDKWSMTVLRVHTKADSEIIASIDPVQVSCEAGVEPTLPNTVTARVKSGGTKAVEVKWQKLNGGMYANPGSLKVEGTVSGTDVKAVANVAIAASSKEWHVAASYGVATNPNVAVATVTNHAGKILKGLVTVKVYGADGTLARTETFEREFMPHRSDVVSYAYGAPDAAGLKAEIDVAFDTEPVDAFKPDLLWYSFDEANGAVVADLSGRGLNGTLAGAAGAAVLADSGVSGKKLSLNAANQNSGYMTVPNAAISGVTDFTIATWVKLDTYDKNMKVFDFGNGTGRRMSFTVSSGTEGGNMTYLIKTNTTNNLKVMEVPTRFQPGKWTHLAVSQSGQTVTVYVDGVPVASRDDMRFRPADLTMPDSNYIGRSCDADDRYFRGGIDDFRMYGRALSEDDVFTLASRYAPKVASVAPVGVDARYGVAPELPGKVKATYENGGSYDTTVKWAAPNASALAAFNPYIIEGRVLGAEGLAAKANVNVVSESIDASFGIDTNIRSDGAEFVIALLQPGVRSVNLICVGYDSTGRMTDYVSKTVTVTDGVLRETLTLPKGAAGLVRAYVWSDSYIPLSSPLR